MGDRVSIQFKDKYGDFSPYLYSHWAGLDLVEAAREFTATIRNDESAGDALAQFIRSSPAARFDDLHIEFEDGGDNSDNGNYAIDIETKQSSPTDPKKEPTKDEIKEATETARSLLITTIQNVSCMKRDLEKQLELFDKKHKGL